MRPILLVGGAPRLAIDAVRFLSVAATGRTALRLHELLLGHGRTAVELLLSRDALPGILAQRYETRADLEQLLRAWILGHPEGMVVMSAAVNDYELASSSVIQEGITTSFAPAQKIPSGADELVLRLRPASKLIDQLRSWGLRGPIIGFKYQERTTLLAAAQALQRRVGAAVVFANSLAGDFQALVDAHGVAEAPSREHALHMLTERMIEM
jgi:hypothetical protein